MTMPTIEAYRGIAVHDFQSRKRIEEIVKPEIDAVYEIHDPQELFQFAADGTKAPESRLFAADKIRAANEIAAAARTGALVDIVKLNAHVAALDCLGWADSDFVGCLIGGSAGRTAATRRSPRDRARLEVAQALAEAQRRR